jgi:alpha-galactosidase
MRRIIILFVLIILLILFTRKYYIQDLNVSKLADKPPMGWNSWNCFKEDVNEQDIYETIDCIVNLDLDTLGYRYIIIDDGWASHQRDHSGNLTADPIKFPSGMKSLGDYIHSKGLKFGLYTSVGRQTCEGSPGSYGYEKQDMEKFAEWGVDYVKIDWCTFKHMWWPFWNYKKIYYNISKAIQDTKRPMVISLCNWGFGEPWKWGPKIAHTWRVTFDIKPNENSIKNIAEVGEKLQLFSGPNKWNDLDMLEIGNGISDELSRYHFETWCRLRSPLILGCDLRKISKEDLEIITNKNLIDINQGMNSL